MGGLVVTDASLKLQSKFSRVLPTSLCIYIVRLYLKLFYVLGEFTAPSV